jgi:hypothetical protein
MMIIIITIKMYTVFTFTKDKEIFLLLRVEYQTVYRPLSFASL